MSDGALAISPVDDLYYYLKDGVLQYEDNREHRSGGGGGRRRGEATEIKPELPVSTVKQINDYWSEYYKPHPNSSQYIYSYQSNESDVGKTISISSIRLLRCMLITTGARSSTGQVEFMFFRFIRTMICPRGLYIRIDMSIFILQVLLKREI